MNREPMNVIIIGAGTGGLCLAHGLKQAGITVAVYERDRTRTDGLQGYRVGINAHGVASLAACLPPDLFATFLATCARTPGHFNILTERLTELLSVTLDEESMGGGKSVSRMTLRQVLLTGLEQHIHFNKTFTRYEQNANGSVTAFFDDGTRATADLLVGADGARSKVRRQLLPEARIENTGIVSIAAKVPMSEASRAAAAQGAGRHHADQRAERLRRHRACHGVPVGRGRSQGGHGRQRCRVAQRAGQDCCSTTPATI